MLESTPDVNVARLSCSLTVTCTQSKNDNGKVFDRQGKLQQVRKNSFVRISSGRSGSEVPTPGNSFGVERRAYRKSSIECLHACGKLIEVGSVTVRQWRVSPVDHLLYYLGYFGGPEPMRKRSSYPKGLKSRKG